MEQSLVSQIYAQRSLEYSVRTSRVVGEMIDSINFQSLTFVIDVGSTTSASTVTIRHSDDQSTWTDISKDDTTLYDDGIYYDPNFPSGITDTRYQVGYIGKKRYVRVVVDGNNTIGVTHIWGHPERVPAFGERFKKQFPV